MQAIILAGGKGTRLHPYTTVFPKPMLPVGNLPIIEIIIKQLVYYGFKDIIISLGYLGHFIEIYFKDEKKIPKSAKIRFVTELKPLGTAGPISLVKNLEDDFLVINGDILTTMNYTDFFKNHKEKKGVMTIAMYPKKVKIDVGVLEFDDNFKIKNFIEKPVYHFYDNTGIYIYNKKVLKFIESNRKLDTNILVLDLIKKKEKVFGYVSKDPCYWIDMGKHGDYELANKEFERRKNEFLKN